MYSLQIRDGLGNNMDFGLGSPFQIIDIDGLAPKDATVNLSSYALEDGARYEGSKVNPRTINIAIAVDKDAEASRLTAYKTLRHKNRVSIWYTSELRQVMIDGYVQTVDVSHFAKKQRITAVIVCPDPYWLDRTITSKSIGTSYTDYTNDGEVAIPLDFTLNISGAVTGITISSNLNKAFKLIGTYQSGDVIKINGQAGNKTVTLTRGGTVTNIFNQIDITSDWLEAAAATTTLFKYATTSGSASRVSVMATFRPRYEGV